MPCKFKTRGFRPIRIETLLGTQIGQPVPGEQALDGDNEVLAKRLDGFQESLGTGAQVAVKQDLALLVQDAHIHPAGVQIHSVIMGMSFGVESLGDSERFHRNQQPRSAI